MNSIRINYYIVCGNLGIIEKNHKGAFHKRCITCQKYTIYGLWGKKSGNAHIECKIIK